MCRILLTVFQAILLASAASNMEIIIIFFSVTPVSEEFFAEKEEGVNL